jgi:hypothetical protein
MRFGMDNKGVAFCPECGGDWPLIPGITFIECECGAMFSVNDEGAITSFAGPAKRLADNPLRWDPREACADPECVCHTTKALAVRTPFPLGQGPVYCCNRCARRADGSSRPTTTPRSIADIMGESSP